MRGAGLGFGADDAVGNVAICVCVDWFCHVEVVGVEIRVIVYVTVLKHLVRN